MKCPSLPVVGIGLVLLDWTCASSSAQSFNAVPVEAESGVLGSELTVITTNGAEAVATTVNATGQAPSGPAQVGTLTVNFPHAGTYELYVRVLVGPNGFDDDSFFYANSFGTMEPQSPADWIMVNGLAGLTGTPGPGGLVLESARSGASDWVWVRLSALGGAATFEVPEAGSTMSFQFATREDGLYIDQFAFGPAGVYFTTEQLESGGTGTAELPEPFVPPGPEIARGNPKFLGSVYSSNDTQNIYFDRYWNALWPGNSGKWGSVEGTRDVMNFAELDEAYAFAKEHGYIFNMHVLIWGNQQPLWLRNLPPEEQLEEIREWFQAVADRYPEIDYLQVVNEPLHDPPDDNGNDSGHYIDALGGTGETGWDWILEAFRMAKEIFPEGTPLMINEYGIVNNFSTATRYREIIDLLLAENLIDAIGVQAHAFTINEANPNTVRATLDLLSETGLPVFATELDIDGLDDAVQLRRYQRVFPIIWEHPGVIGVNLAGARIGMWRTNEGAYLINADESERPALQWLREYVESTTPRWRGHLLVDTYWANTGDWLGWLHVQADPWVFSHSLGTWLYLPEPSDTESGAWIWVPILE